MKLAFQKGLLSARVSASVMGLGLVLAAGQTLALTPAGTDINNRATVTYEDANGNSYSAQSNESTVTVAEVYAATLENDGNKSGAPGETVYFTHTLTNTGNAADSLLQPVQLVFMIHRHCHQRPGTGRNFTLMNYRCFCF